MGLEVKNMAKEKEYVFWWIARPGEGESEDVNYFSTAQRARAYAVELLKTEKITQFGKGYWHDPRNKIPLTAKIVDVITPKGHTTTVLSFKSKLYAVKIKKDAKGTAYQVFYPMLANGTIIDRPMSKL